MNQTRFSSPEPKIGLIVLGVMLGVFLSSIDALVVGTAMPTVVADLGGLHLYSWVFSSYMLMAAVFMPLFGKLSDLWGKKRMFIAAVATFLLGSILSGTATNMLQLVLYRLIQGIGAGGMASVPFAIIGSVFPPVRRGRAFGFVAVVWGISSIVGPALGSFIVTHFSWRWVFYINIPFGLASIALIMLAYHEMRPFASNSVDIRGALTLGLSIVSILVAFFRVGKGEAIFSTTVLILVGIFLLTIYLFFILEKRARNPILPLQFFKVRAFATSNICGFLGGFAIFGGIAFVPLFIQSVQGGTPVNVAMVVTPISIGWSGASIVSGQLLHTVGARLSVLLGMSFMALGFLLASFVRVDSSLSFMIVSGMLIGMGMGTQTPALIATAQNSLHSDVIGVATSTQMLSRMLGGTIGASVMGAVLTYSMQSDFRHSAAGILSGLPDSLQSHLAEPHRFLEESVRANLDPAQLNFILNVFTHALHNVFVTGFVVALLGMIAALFLPRSAR